MFNGYAKGYIWVMLIASVLVGAGCASTYRTSEWRRTKDNYDHKIYGSRTESAQKRTVRAERPAWLDEPAPVPVTSASAVAKTATVKPAGAEGEDLLPPEAKPGECYARVMIPATYRTKKAKVLVQEAAESYEIVPAEYEWDMEKVTIKEPSEALEIVPAKYDWVEERVQIEPARTELKHNAAQYEWKEERVLVKEAHTVWKKGRGPIEELDNATGEIMCLVEVPAKYETVRKQVLKTPATTHKVTIPARYETVRKEVVVSPAETRTVQVPGEYKTVRVKKMIRPEQKKALSLPAQYRTVERQVMASKGGVTWKRVLCETNMSRDMIRHVQQALVEGGYDAGDVDGVLGPQTKSALEEYQVSHGLAVGGLTYETLRHMGVVPEQVAGHPARA